MHRIRAAARRVILIATAGALALGVALAPACGKKGPPIPWDSKQSQAPAGGAAGQASPAAAGPLAPAATPGADDDTDGPGSPGGQ